eukprot:Clim_evm82s147 gene=Clim_evmTU82s147
MDDDWVDLDDRLIRDRYNEGLDSDLDDDFEAMELPHVRDENGTEDKLTALLHELEMEAKAAGTNEYNNKRKDFKELPEEGVDLNRGKREYEHIGATVHKSDAKLAGLAGTALKEESTEADVTASATDQEKGAHGDSLEELAEEIKEIREIRKMTGNRPPEAWGGSLKEYISKQVSENMSSIIGTTAEERRGNVSKNSEASKLLIDAIQSIGSSTLASAIVDYVVAKETARATNDIDTAYIQNQLSGSPAQAALAMRKAKKSHGKMGTRKPKKHLKGKAKAPMRQMGTEYESQYPVQDHKDSQRVRDEDQIIVGEAPNYDEDEYVVKEIYRKAKPQPSSSPSRSQRAQAQTLREEDVPAPRPLTKISSRTERGASMLDLLDSYNLEGLEKNFTSGGQAAFEDVELEGVFESAQLGGELDLGVDTQPEFNDSRHQFAIDTVEHVHVVSPGAARTEAHVSYVPKSSFGQDDRTARGKSTSPVPSSGQFSEGGRKVGLKTGDVFIRVRDVGVQCVARVRNVALQVGPDNVRGNVKFTPGGAVREQGTQPSVSDLRFFNRNPEQAAKLYGAQHADFPQRQNPRPVRAAHGGLAYTLIMDPPRTQNVPKGAAKERILKPTKLSEENGRSMKTGTGPDRHMQEATARREEKKAAEMRLNI